MLSALQIKASIHSHPKRANERDGDNSHGDQHESTLALSICYSHANTSPFMTGVRSSGIQSISVEREDAELVCASDSIQSSPTSKP